MRVPVEHCRAPAFGRPPHHAARRPLLRPHHFRSAPPPRAALALNSKPEPEPLGGRRPAYCPRGAAAPSRAPQYHAHAHTRRVVPAARAGGSYTQPCSRAAGPAAAGALPPLGEPRTECTNARGRRPRSCGARRILAAGPWPPRRAPPPRPRALDPQQARRAPPRRDFAHPPCARGGAPPPCRPPPCWLSLPL
ncbi:MAG: hypothetical protein J3K34DRAFT_62119 [Monoraphidium minutum]|nr:MAG: hypothetical protein J3K34DRAFT_62119 [Monoraphidium minutum]